MMTILAKWHRKWAIIRVVVCLAADGRHRGDSQATGRGVASAWVDGKAHITICLSDDERAAPCRPQQMLTIALRTYCCCFVYENKPQYQFKWSSRVQIAPRHPLPGNLRMHSMSGVYHIQLVRTQFTRVGVFSARAAH